MKHILAVDDNKTILEAISCYLSKEGFVVHQAQNSEEMWAIAEKYPIDLFLLDLHLGAESGLDIVRSIRQTSNVGIMIISGDDSEVDRVVGLEIGADDYITKPFSLRELLARIRRLLKRSSESVFQLDKIVVDEHNQPHKIYRFLDWQVDIDSRQVFNNAGEEIELTTSEFNLLCLFLQKPNQTLNREILLERLHNEHVWFGSDRKIDGLVSRLRKKIEANQEGKATVIKTIRNIGYIFTPDVEINRR